MRPLQPEVEASFVEVNQHLLLFNKLCYLYGEVILRHWSFLKGLVIHVRNLQIFDLMLLVEVLERGATEDHVVLELYELQTLADREATPLLEHTVPQKELPQVGVDISLETIPAIQNAPVDVLTFPLEHPSVRVVDCVQPDEKGVRDLAISFALLPPFKDAFRLPCCDLLIRT